MLTARSRIDVHRDSSGNDNGSVVAEIEVAGNAVNHWKSKEKHEAGKPAGVDSKAATGEPEGSHRVTFNDGRMAADAAHGQSEDEGLRGLPGEINSPTHPEGAGTQIGRSEQEAENH